MTSKSQRTFDVTSDGILMSIRCTFDVKARDIGVAISVGIGVAISVDIGVDSSVDGGVDISADIGVAIGVSIRVDIGVAIRVDTCTSKHIKSFDGGLMVDKGHQILFDVPGFDVHQTIINYTSNYIKHIKPY